jgi:hypothetical protein
MPYIWISLVVFFGMQDDVFTVGVVTLWAWVTMWGCEELRAMGERAIAWDSRIVWMAVDELRGEVK